MDLVGGVRIPDDELAVLRGGDKMSSVRRPVHGVDFSQVTFQVSTRLHAYAW